MNIVGNVFLVILIILVIYVIVSCVRIVPQAQAYRLLTGWQERCS